MISDLSSHNNSDRSSDNDWYQYIVEVAAEGIWVVNQDLEITFVNQKLVALLCYSTEEMRGRSLFDFMDIEAMEFADLEFQRRLASSKAEVRSEYDFRFIRKDGIGLWAIVNTRPLFDENSNYAGSLGMIVNVTRRRQYEENLRESEEYYRLLANYSTDMISCHSVYTIFTYVSSICLSLTGYAAEELIDRPILEFIHPEDRIKVELIHSMVLKHIGMVNRVTYRFIRKNGEYIWLEMTKRAIQDAITGEVRVICAARDIQGRKEIEQTLVKTNSRLSLALETSATGTWEWDILTGKVACSERTNEIFGYGLNPKLNPKNNLTYKDFMRSVHTSDRHHIVTAFRNAIHSCTVYAIEFRVLRSDGKLVWIDGRGQVYCGANGSPHLVIGVAIDITQRKESEQEIKRQLNKESLLRQVTENIRFRADLDRVFKNLVDLLGDAFNTDRCLIHTYEVDPLISVSVIAEYIRSDYESILDIEIPLDHPLTIEVMSADRAIAIDNVFTDPRLSELSEFFTRIQLKSILLVRTSHYGIANGFICFHQCAYFRHWTHDEIHLLEAIAAHVGIAIAQAKFQEIEKSQRLQLISQNLALQESQQLAEAANQAKSEFLAMMSHEIRTPMNAVIGITELLLNSELSTQDKEYLEMIRTGGQSLIVIINDILDFSKIESNKLELEHRPLDLWECITDTVELLKPTAIAKSLNLTCNIDSQVPKVIKGDVMRFKQILINLLGNAIKFTEAGQIELLVTATPALKATQITAQSPSEIKFAIKDTGVGIPSNLMTRLFKPFSQVDASTTRQHGGTGLGLVISKNLCEMMGGKMWAISCSLNDQIIDLETLQCLAGVPPSDFVVAYPLEIGSIFYFTIMAIPIFDESESTSSESTSISKNDFINPPLAQQLPLKILLVEDNLVNQKVALKILGRMGYSADIAENGVKAIASLQASMYDVVFMDIQMPEMDGLTATKAIRLQHNSPNSPYIIAMTANAMIGDREICIEAGMNDYISKPISIEKIGNALIQLRN